MKRRLDFLVDEKVVEALDRVRGHWCTTRTGAIIQMILREDSREALASKGRSPKGARSLQDGNVSGKGGARG